ncbi:hypothetical protein PLIIFM63780_000365 [Purpureocillium lilacinum]|uniref:Uncharacterized protein n=1 Tax=Purpureocillium lilacinum TaxID=33203 RepID=A0ABR0BM43_PURLI|nr:hypothetical protein Purlil1_10715 [Purpureocillium lilacinum]GJN76877.1 hypothetical protein PLIIFM63780_000365 [Purpureocillium lilacinum]
MEDDSETWDLDIPFQDANDDNADWKRVKNLPGELHRENVVGDKASSRVKGRLIAVVHGYKTNGRGEPRTLVVFEWLLSSPAGSHRLENVEIEVRFLAEGRRAHMAPGETLAMWHPWPVEVAPSDPVTSQEAVVAVSRTRANELGIKAGYAPFFDVSAKTSPSKTLNYKMIDYRCIKGSTHFWAKNSGKHNAVLWEISENASLQSGVPYRLRTAVMLARNIGDRDKFSATVVTRTNVWPIQRVVEEPLRAVGIARLDDPIYFDPTVVPALKKKTAALDDDDIQPADIAARRTRHNAAELGSVNIYEELIKDPLDKTVAPDPDAGEGTDGDSEVAGRDAVASSSSVELSLGLG